MCCKISHWVCQRIERFVGPRLAELQKLPVSAKFRSFVFGSPSSQTFDGSSWNNLRLGLIQHAEAGRGWQSYSSSISGKATGDTCASMADLPYLRVRDVVLAHPTMAEGLGFLFTNMAPRSVQEVIPKRA
jgi:hypothetical protein